MLMFACILHMYFFSLHGQGKEPQRSTLWIKGNVKNVACSTDYFAYSSMTDFLFSTVRHFLHDLSGMKGFKKKGGGSCDR